MHINPDGVTALFTYIVLPITITFLLAQLFTHGKPVQRRGWKNWFLLLVSLGTGLAVTLVDLILGKLATGPELVSFINYYLTPSALIVASVTFSLKGSRYLPSTLIPPVTILLTSLIPSTVKMIKAEETYDGTLPMYIPFVIFILLPVTLLTCTVANIVFAKLNSKKNNRRKTSEPMPNTYTFLQNCAEQYNIDHKFERTDKEDSDHTETTYTFTGNDNTWTHTEETAPATSKYWATSAPKLREGEIFVEQLARELEKEEKEGIRGIFSTEEQFLEAASKAAEYINKNA